MRALALDVGTKRIGLAFADTAVRIAVPRSMVEVNGAELAQILRAYRQEKADLLVVGRPRNNRGDTTRQTVAVEEFIKTLKTYFVNEGEAEPPIVFQDESYTSVQAEDNLGSLSRQDRQAGKVDIEAATLILQDFLERSDLATIEDNLRKE